MTATLLAPSRRALFAPAVGVTNKETEMTTKTLTKADLAQFTGTERYYRHGINRKVCYTEGAQHVAEAGGAYWLLDEIRTSVLRF